MASPTDDMSVDGDNDINQLVEDIIEGELHLLDFM